MDTKALISRIEEIRAIADNCLAMLGAAARSQGPAVAALKAKRSASTIDFSKPVRPFMRAYARGLSGPKKFVLLLAWLAKGDPKMQVPQSEIQKHWNRMTGILGLEFNRFFASAAKDQDWVEAKTKGMYNLRPTWKEAANHAE